MVAGRQFGQTRVLGGKGTRPSYTPIVTAPVPALGTGTEKCFPTPPLHPAAELCLETFLAAYVAQDVAR